MKSENIYKIMFCVFLLSFILGGYLLENLGIQYVSDGGSSLGKIHITSYILFFCIGMLTLEKGLNKPLANLKELRGAWLVSTLSISVVIFYGLFRFGTSGMAYLIDTIVSALLAVYLLSQLNSEHKKKLLRLLAYLLFINAVIAILEFILGKTLVDVSFSSFSHFRSTALLTHPLNNALITAALAPLLMNQTRFPTLLYFTVIFLALFAFGGRAAVGVFLFGTFILVAPKIPAFLTKGIKMTKIRFAALQALTFCAVIFTSLVIIFTPIGSRILSKLHVDGSAQARFDVFIILEQLSPSEWVFGASQELINNIAFYIEIDVIENYLIGWIVSFGLICTFLLIVSCYKLPVKLARNSNIRVSVALIVFIIVSLTNNALTTKTPALLLFFSALYLSRSLENKA
ncbi:MULTISPECIES: VpsF family polysaccharide biosynthesis protein [unclassified Pseudoalteromonas]|uniref:VpsF family polysaccharide biosynthesis protein n=1 Tax=unclassified Pseudoalteromonas TaxID=194690 RepID=UPI0038680708